MKWSTLFCLIHFVKTPFPIISIIFYFFYFILSNLIRIIIYNRAINDFTDYSSLYTSGTQDMVKTNKCAVQIQKVGPCTVMTNRGRCSKEQHYKFRKWWFVENNHHYENQFLFTALFCNNTLHFEQW